MLTVGGARADVLAEHFGTPALLLDLAVFDRSLKGILEAASARGMRISYAAKALLMAVLEAQQWCDKMENKQEMSEIVGRRHYGRKAVAPSSSVTVNDT